jgi:uncharacterized membrane protein YdjX (TVP38/TMEM64 family)
MDRVFGTQGQRSPQAAGEDGDTTATAATRYARRWGFGLALLGLITGLLIAGPQLWALARDPAALEAWVASLGWLGPLALVAFNALQIVIAPIPGYVVQIAAGFLFGAFWGGVWGTLGLLAGSSLAFWLARLYGRPLAARLIGAARLDQWEKVTYSTSTLVWFVLLLGPTGDAPYFLAGLSRVSYLKILSITAILRIPSVFVAAAIGAGVMWLNWWQLALLFALLTGVIVALLRYHDTILRWTERSVQQRLDGSFREDSS